MWCATLLRIVVCGVVFQWLVLLTVRVVIGIFPNRTFTMWFGTLQTLSLGERCFDAVSALRWERCDGALRWERCDGALRVLFHTRSCTACRVRGDHVDRVCAANP